MMHSTSDLAALGDAMSEVSEECWNAGWLDGTEHMLPELCRRASESGTDQRWGRGTITPSRARELQGLARRAGTWAALDEQGIGYVPFEPWPLPNAMLQELDLECESGQDAARAHPSGGAPSIRRYIFHNYAALMTASEWSVYKSIVLAQKSTAHSAQRSEEMRASAGRLSSEVAAALASGPEPFLEAVAARILREHPSEVFLNRCPSCGALCRTPRAKLCPVCHRSWHRSSS